MFSKLFKYRIVPKFDPWEGSYFALEQKLLFGWWEISTSKNIEELEELYLHLTKEDKYL